MPKPHELGQHLGPARLGVGLGLEHQDAGALGQHGAVALLGEREAALGRKHVHRLPGAHDAVVDHALGGADDGDVGQPVADVVAADADRMRRRRAGAAGGECGALDAELDADMRRGRRADEAQQRQRVGCPLLVDEQVAVARFHGLQAAGARADDAGHAVGILERRLQTRLLDGLVRRRRREPGVAVGVQDDLVALEVLQAHFGIEVPDLRPDQDLEVGQVEPVEWADAELAAFAAGPELGHRRADRRHDANTRHDDAVRYPSPLHLYFVPSFRRLRRRMAILAGARGQALAAAAPEPAIKARTRSTTEPTVLKSAASSLAL